MLSRGVLHKLVTLIKDLHANHSAIVRAALDSRSITTHNGFTQGCVFAQHLFNITLDNIVLLPQLRQLGVTISYKMDGQLMHSRHRTEEEPMSILVYAEDILLMCDDMDSLRTAATPHGYHFHSMGFDNQQQKDKGAHCRQGC